MFHLYDALLVLLIERVQAGVGRVGAEGFLDTQELIVFCDTIGPGCRARLDLAGIRSDSEIGDEGVFGFAAPVRDYGGVAGSVRHLDRVERLAERPDLVDFDQNAVSGAFLNPALKVAGICYEKVIPDQLYGISDGIGQFFPAVPVVFGQSVLNGDDGVLG